MDSSARLDEAYLVARMYYGDGTTMESIAGRLDVSRSTVSRLLRDARTHGIVTFTLTPPDQGLPGLGEEIEARWGISARVVAVDPGFDERARMEQVAAVAAQDVDAVVASGMTVGLAWGTTMSTVARHLVPRPRRGVRIVQLNGGINTEGGGLGHASGVMSQFAQAFAAEANHFAVPAFFDHASTREALWRERSTQRIVELQRGADVALFGAGTFTSGVPSRVYSSGYLGAEDMRDLRRSGVVGDVCTVFLREDGTWRDIPMNVRCSGPTPDDLRKIPRRLLVVSGHNKVAVLRGALEAGVATDLVVDDVTAQLLLRSGPGEVGGAWPDD